MTSPLTARLDLADPDRDSWRTPAELAAVLGTFDLDPCSTAGDHVRARARCRRADGGDGLAVPLRAGLRVFINPPYSRGSVAQWAARYVRADLDVTWLVRLAPGAAWWETLANASRELWTCRRRVRFEPPPGVMASSPAIETCLVMTGRETLDPLVAHMVRRRLGELGWRRWITAP